jgi:hypothetical protein
MRLNIAHAVPALSPPAASVAPMSSSPLLKVGLSATISHLSGKHKIVTIKKLESFSFFSENVGKEV